MAYDPWLEIDASALRDNTRRVAGLSGGRPILAVVKNNAYGLGLEQTASLLEREAAIAGFAVVKPDAALSLKTVGIRKPVLLMGIADDEQSVELARRGIDLSFYTDGAGDRAARLARALGGPVPGQLYLDTGMGRMGMPHYRALPWIRSLASAGTLRIRGTFMAFTEDSDFDLEQLDRFQALISQARSDGIDLGTLHAASSNGVYHLPDAHLDQVRPGIALFGAYPSRPDEEREKQPLRPAVRLRARVVRTQRLRPGDGVSYGRNYVAERPTWTATLPVGTPMATPRRGERGPGPDRGPSLPGHRCGERQSLHRGSGR